MRITCALSVVLLTGWPRPALSTQYPWGSTKGLSRDEFLDKLVGKLTVQELAQHLSLFKGSEVFDANGNATYYPSAVGDRGIGEVNFWTPPNTDQFNELQRLQIESARVPSPILLTGECLHGLQAANTTIFPTNLNLANSWDPHLVHEVARKIALETRGRGVHGCYAPVLDLAKDARWGRIGEDFGEDKHLTSTMGVAYIKGLQNGGKLRSLNSAFSTMKHFTAHGDGDGGRNIAPSHIGPRQIANEYNVPFRDAVQLANARGVMMAYQTIDGLPCIYNPDLYESLRGEWGFDGRVIADDHDIYRAYDWHRAADTPEQAIAKWLNVGGDTNYADWPTSEWISYIESAVSSGLVSMSTLRQRVKEQMIVIYDLGLFDNPYYPTNFTTGKVDQPETAAVALKAAQASIVLLKNDGTLPLSKSEGPRIALIGPFGDTTSALRGTYVRSGISYRVTTLRQSLLNYTQHVTSSWGAPAWLDYRSEIIPLYSFRPTLNSSEMGLKGTYYHDTNFQNVAYVRTVDSPKLEWDMLPPFNSPDGTQVLANNSFSVRWEGYFTSPANAKAALGAATSNGWAALYVDGRMIANATSGSIISSYSDGPTGSWAYYEQNSTQLPLGTAEFDFQEGKTYHVRLDFNSGGQPGLVYPAWNLVDRQDGVASALTTAQNADLVVLAIGSDPESDSETNDVANIALSPNQTTLVDAVFALNKSVVLVVFGPRPKAIPEYYTRAAAVLAVGYPGQAGGEAIGNVLFGDINPSGRISVTVPISTGTIPAFYNHEGSDYRYWYRDTTQRSPWSGDLQPFAVYGGSYLWNPAYPFGYGISYTTFEYSDIQCSQTSFGLNDVLKFSFNVKNTGNFDGGDVPQIYLLWRYASTAQPRLQLTAFSKVTIAAGGSKNVELEVDVRRVIASYNATMDFGIDASPGANFSFGLMHHSQDVQTNNVTIEYSG